MQCLQCTCKIEPDTQRHVLADTGPRVRAAFRQSLGLTFDENGLICTQCYSSIRKLVPPDPEPGADDSDADTLSVASNVSVKTESADSEDGGEVPATDHGGMPEPTLGNRPVFFPTKPTGVIQSQFVPVANNQNKFMIVTGQGRQNLGTILPTGNKVILVKSPGSESTFVPVSNKGIGSQSKMVIVTSPGKQTLSAFVPVTNKVINAQQAGMVVTSRAKERQNMGVPVTDAASRHVPVADAASRHVPVTVAASKDVPVLNNAFNIFMPLRIAPISPVNVINQDSVKTSQSSNLPSAPAAESVHASKGAAEQRVETGPEDGPGGTDLLSQWRKDHPYRPRPMLKRAKSNALTVNEKTIALNVYEYIYNNMTVNLKLYPYTREIIQQVAEIMGTSRSTIYRVMREYKKTGRVSSPKPYKPTPRLSLKERLGEETVTKIKQLAKDMGTSEGGLSIESALAAINRDKDLPTLSRSTLRRLFLMLEVKTTRQLENPKQKRKTKNAETKGKSKKRKGSETEESEETDETETSEED